MKLVVLGDSIIKGVLFTTEENGRGHYSLAEQNIVDQVAAKLHSEVVNLGKMGCTIATGEKILDRYLVHLNSANYVLMFIIRMISNCLPIIVAIITSIAHQNIVSTI